MITRGIVFESPHFWSPYGTIQPADLLPDFSRYGNDGVFAGAGEPDWVQEHSGLWTLDFDGADDSIAIAHDPSHLLIGGGSLIAWIAPDNLGKNNVGRIWDKSTAGAGDAGYTTYLTGASPSQVVFKLDGSAAALSGAVIVWATWMFIVVTFNVAGTTNFYVNGALSGTANQATNAASGITDVGPLYLGDRGTDTTNFDGTIALPMIYNYVLSPDAINEMYQADRYLLGA